MCRGSVFVVAVLACCFVTFSSAVPTYTVAVAHDLGASPVFGVAAQAAWSMINANTQYNTVLNLSIFLQNTGADNGVAQNMVQYDVNNRNSMNIVGIEGTTYSSTTVFVQQQVTTAAQMPLVSSASTSPLLASTTNYPYFLRTNPTNDDSITGIATLVRQLGGANRGVAVIYKSADTAVQSSVLAFMSSAQAVGIRIAVNISYDVGSTVQSYANEVFQIKASGANVIYIAAQESQYGVMLNAFQQAGIVYPKYIIVGGQTMSAPGVTFINGVQSAQAMQALANALVVIPSPGSGASYNTFNQLFQQYRAQLPAAQQPLCPVNANAEATYTADAMTLYAMAIKALLQQTPTAGNPLSGPAMMAQLRATSFQGISGNVQFTAGSNNIPPRTYNVMQINAQGAQTAVGTFSLSANPQLNIAGSAVAFPAMPFPTYTVAVEHDVGANPVFQVAALAATAMLQNNSNFNTVFNLLSFIQNTGSDSGVAINLATYDVQNRFTQNIVGILGTTYSSTTIAVANSVATPNKFPMVSSASTSPLLASTTNYPYFLRTNPTNDDAITGIATLVRRLGGENRGVAVIYKSADTAVQSSVLAFISSAQAVGIRVAVNISYDVFAVPSNYASEINQIKASGANVIYISAQESQYGVLLTAFQQAGIVAPQYIIVGGASISAPGATFINGVQSQAAIQALTNALAVVPSPGSGPMYSAFDQMYTLYRAQLPANLQLLCPVSASADATYTADAMMLYALAIKNLVVQGANYNPLNGDIMMSQLRGTVFTGISGNISYTVGSNNVSPRTYNVLQIQSSGAPGSLTVQPLLVGTFSLAATPTLQVTPSVQFPPVLGLQITQGAVAIGIAVGVVVLFIITAIAWSQRNRCRGQPETKSYGQKLISGDETL